VVLIKASVIVPVYNNPEGIRALIDALLAQTYPSRHFEIIIVDNNSTDETADVVRSIASKNDDRIKLAMETTIQSSYAARNRGIEESSGEFLAFVDSDCTPAASWLENGIGALENDSVACGGGKVEFFYQSDRPNAVEYLDSARKLDQRHYVEDLGFAATANFFARRDLFAQKGMFRADVISGGDFEFGRRVTSQGQRIAYINDAVVTHPARATVRELLKKSKRVAVGQKQLGRLGLAGQVGPSWKQLVPARSWPDDGNWSRSLTIVDKAKILALQTLVRWVNFWTRVR
jgi:glycosyltransferase involved in cell wall biosynthesis